jgi:glycosyltransferase involved in cell wall biosynthesis
LASRNPKSYKETAAQPRGSKNLAVLIPARNEAATIESIVTQARRYADAVCVVDDGSTDKTGRAAKIAGAVVLANTKPRGLGGAIQAGLAELFSSGYSTVATIDGDGAHDPHLIPGIVKHHWKANADLTIGSRLLDPRPVCNFPSPKESANRFAALLLRRLAGTHLTDVASGMRVMSSSISCLPSLSLGYGYSFELICAATVERLVISEYPTTARYDATDLFATRTEELGGLLLAAKKYVRPKALRKNIDRMLLQAERREEMRVRLFSRLFFLHPLSDRDAYLIQEQHHFFLKRPIGKVIYL